MYNKIIPSPVRYAVFLLVQVQYIIKSNQLQFEYFRYKSNDFFKLNCDISQLYVMLMNGRMKTKYMLVFCNSFLKIDLNSD